MTVYFVSTTGNNGGSGSIGDPWQTVQHAANTAVAGDIVNILAGTYFERVTFPNSGGGSGSRIVFQGVRGSGGSWDTIIDGSTSESTGWSAVGDGSFTKSLGYTAQFMSGNGLSIWRIGDHVPASGSGGSNSAYGYNDYFSWPANGIITLPDVGDAPFWDGIEALFRSVGGTTRVRFRNSQNPSTMAVRAAASGGALTVTNKNWLTLKDLKVRGAQWAIRVSGTSSNVLIDNNYITHGQYGVYVTNTTNIVISNNYITEDGIAFSVLPGGDQTLGDFAQTGTWRRSYRGQYQMNKFYVGDTETDGSRITLDGSVTSPTITGNTIEHSIAGTTLYADISNLVFSYNTTRFHSDNGMYVNGGDISAEIHHNHFFDCDHGIRFQSNWAQNDWFIYANKFCQPWYPPSGGGAKHLNWDTTPGNNQSSNMQLYHNSYAGGGWANDVGSDGETIDLSWVTIQNNFFSTTGITSGPVTWNFFNNYEDNIWFEDVVPSFILPNGHPALNSAPSLVGSGLPGMDAAYYGDGDPDYGAVQAAADEMPINGDLSVTEGNDSVLSAGVIPVKAVLSVVEGDDLLSGGNVIKVAVTRFSGIGIVLGLAQEISRLGSLVVTEGDDSVLAVGGVEVIGVLSIIESEDLILSNGIVEIIGVLNVVESDDILVATNDPGLNATLVVVEEDDALLAVGILESFAVLDLVEGTDFIVSAGFIGSGSGGAVGHGFVLVRRRRR